MAEFAGGVVILAFLTFGPTIGDRLSRLGRLATDLWKQLLRLAEEALSKVVVLIHVGLVRGCYEGSRLGLPLGLAQARARIVGILRKPFPKVHRHARGLATLHRIMGEARWVRGRSRRRLSC